jgi:hypothetical protein
MPIIKGDGFTAIVCTRGQRKRRCHYCNRPAPYLCDHPVIRNGKRGTCDIAICEQCRHNVQAGVDLCRPHFGLYEKNGMKFKLGDVEIINGK